MITNKTARDFIIAKKLFPGGGSIIETDTTTGSVANFETNIVAPIVEGICYINPIQEGSGDPSPLNPRPITGTSTLHVNASGSDTSDPTTYTIALGRTVYGGSSEVVGGSGSITHIKKRLLHTDNWETARGAFYLDDFFTDMPNTFVTNKTTPKCMSEIGKEDNCISHSSEVPSRDDHSYFNQLSTYQNRLWLKDSTFSTLSDFLDYLENNEVYMIIPIVTPTVFSFTGQEINTLNGENNIWHDGNGNISVTYQKKVPGPGGIDKRQFLPLIYGKKHYRKEY